jgi:tRNA-2-methylthio-N6-dimethylallyladenosine synthase
MEEVRYADLFSFMYSSRPGTAAAGLRDELGQEQKLERLHRLQSLQNRITREIYGALVGSRQQVLLEGATRRPGQLFGRTDGNRIVNVEAPPELVGALAEVAVTRSLQNSLVGRIEEYCQ